MADQIKELSNGTYFVGALSNGVAIASTDATTRNVVKDIHVQNNQLNAISAPLNFVVNGVTAASLSSSVGGSEIIDVSSTAVAQATATFELQVFENWMVTNAVDSRINTQTSRQVNSVNATSAFTQSAVITTAPTLPNNVVSWATIGSNFYYWGNDGNTTQALYRRTGGVNGTQTAIGSISSYMPVAFNGVDKFHWVTTTQIYTHNATTNANSVVTLDTTGVSWPALTSSFPRISFANGLVFWAFDGQNGCWAINPSTGKMSYITGPLNTNTNVAFEVYYTGGTYYIVQTSNVLGGAVGAFYVYTISDTVVGPLTSANTTGAAANVYAQSTYTPEVALNFHWPKMSFTGDFVFLSAETSGSIYVYKRFNVVTRTFATQFTIDVSTITPNAGATYQIAPFRTLSITSDTANKLNTTFYPQTATLRVTGVQTTP